MNKLTVISFLVTNDTYLGAYFCLKSYFYAMIKKLPKELFKLIEVVMTFSTLFFFHYASAAGVKNMDTLNVVNGTLIAYTILPAILILAEILSFEVNRMSNILLTFTGFGLLTATGIILVDKGIKEIYIMEDYMTATAGFLGLVNGILFLVDSILLTKVK